MNRGLVAGGVYLPPFRVASDTIEEAWDSGETPGIQSVAVPSADEDAITMAMAAAERALNQDTTERETIGLVGLATTTPPIEEEVLVPRLTKALGLPSDVTMTSSVGSTLAGAELLETGLNADEPALLVVSDCPTGAPDGAGQRMGAGAAAIIIDDHPSVAVQSRSWHVDEYPGIRFRSPVDREVETLGITPYERGSITEATTTALDGLGVDLEQCHGIALHQPDGSLPYRIARALPIEGDQVERGLVADRIGDAGAATVAIGLLGALESAGPEDEVVASFFASGGGASAFSFVGGFESGIEAELSRGEPLTYSAYLRKRGHVVEGDIGGGGAFVSLPTWLRTLDHRYHLEAGQCPNCGELAFPPEGACPSCHERVEFESYSLPQRAEIAALTIVGKGSAPPEFDRQQRRDGSYGVAIVEFETDAGSVCQPGQLVTPDPQNVAVGDTVRPVFRRIYEQGGVPRYGMKFAVVA